MLKVAGACYGIIRRQGDRRREEEKGWLCPGTQGALFVLLLSEFNNQKKKKKRVISAMLAYELQY